MKKITRKPLTVHPDVIFKELDGEYLLVNLKTDKIFSLNKTGSLVWEGISIGLSITEISKKICSDYKISN